MFLRGGVSISALVRQAQLEQSCYQRAFQEHYDGNHQRLHFVPHSIQKVEWNVLPNGHRLFGIPQSVLQLFPRSKQPLRGWLHRFLLLQSCWMHWVRHATACVQGIYVGCSSKVIHWCWGIYPLRGEIKRLEVVWTGMLGEFCHSYDDFGSFNRYCGRLELWLSHYSAGQNINNLQTIWVTRWHGQYIWVSEPSTRQLNPSLWILQASLLPFFPFLRKITLRDIENKCCEGTTDAQSRGCKEGLLAYFSSSQRAVQHW